MTDENQPTETPQPKADETSDKTKLTLPQRISKEFDYFFEKLRKIDFGKLGSAIKSVLGVIGKVFAPIGKILPLGFLKRIFRKMRIFTLIFWVASIVLSGILIKEVFFTKIGEQAQESGPQEEAEEDILPVRVFKVGRFNYEDSLNVLGSIKGGVEFKLSFEIPGVINSINYREGERYEEGALLVSLRQDDILIRLKRAQAERNKSETALDIANDQLQENQTLFEMGAIPKSSLEKAKLEVESAEYDVESAHLEVKLNEAMLEKSNLYAPSDGMIGELYVEEGETVTPNSLVGSHIATDVVFAEFGVVERDVGKLALGQKARVYVDSYPDKTFEGVVENVAPVVAGTSRTATARVRIENHEGMLLPGMFSRIKILLYSKRNALVVPTDSIQGREEEAFVFVVNQRTNQVAKRNVKIGYTRPDYSQVDAGLEEGEWVSVSALEKLEEGLEVKVVEEQQVEL